MDNRPILTNCCALCRRAVDAETHRRARRVFEPLIVCDSCLQEADRRWTSAVTRMPVAA